jgi:hypothetical protein
MALNINLVNGGINVYETGETPRTYFGAIGASGKIYPSGSINGELFSGLIISSTLVVPDDYYTDIPQSSTSGSGINGLFNFGVSSGVVSYGNIYSGSGYALGDIAYINGSDVIEGGSGTLAIKITALALDGILFVVGGDDYQVQWSNLVINGTSPTSLSDAMTLLSNLLIGVTGQPYKVYTAILNQSGGNAPTATVLQNTIHPDLAWGYNATGRYGISTGGANAFINQKCITIQGSLTNNTGALVGSIYGQQDDETNYKIYTWDNNISDYADGLLTNYTIEIRVYN